MNGYPIFSPFGDEVFPNRVLEFTQGPVGVFRLYGGRIGDGAADDIPQLDRSLPAEDIACQATVGRFQVFQAFIWPVLRGRCGWVLGRIVHGGFLSEVGVSRSRIHDTVVMVEK